MNFDNYTSGTWKDQFQYQSFCPTHINQQWQWQDAKIDTLLAEANRRLGELNGLSYMVPDLDRFISMHVVKEAQSSSRIEGTRTEMDEALEEDEQLIAPEKRDDWQEVRNYITAMNEALENIETLPLSNRLLCDTHRTLLSGTRGEKKTPGEFRRSQNWIGGATIQDAAFIPPHHEDLPLLLSDLESFWHNESIHVPQLIRIAISHYQFETIHPYLDGNGRIGRLLITLYLVDKGLLENPCLYLSSHLEKNRNHYYDALTRTRETNDLGHWVRFFLVAVIETAKIATSTFKEILKLRTQTTEIITTLGRTSANAAKIVDYLYQKPYVNSQMLTDKLGLSQSTVDRIVPILIEKKILYEITGKSRNRIFYFKEYFNLFL